MTIYATENVRYEWGGAITVEWHCEPPIEGVPYMVDRDEYADGVRRIHEWHYWKEWA